MRHVQTGRHVSKPHGFVLDEEVGASPLLAEIHQYVAYLGFRLAPSLPVEVSKAVRCKRCEVALSEVDLHEH